MDPTTNMTNPYKVLGVDRDVDDAGLRLAYRAAVKRCHPDHGGSPEEFIVVQEAYEQLSDPAARRDVDAFLDRPAASGPQTGGYTSPTAPTPDVDEPLVPGGSYQARNRARFRQRQAPTGRAAVAAWLELRCAFECDLRGITLSVLDQRQGAATEAVASLKAAGEWDELLDEELATWRSRVAEIRSEIMDETAPSEFAARLRYGPRNRGMLADRTIAVVFSVAAAAALVGAGELAYRAGAESAAIRVFAGIGPAAVIVFAGVFWWLPTWLAGWVRLGWGQRARRAAIAAGVTTALFGAGLWGSWAHWVGYVAAVTVLSAATAWVADRRLRATFPPKLWGPQRRVRAVRESVQARRDRRDAARAERAARRRR